MQTLFASELRYQERSARHELGEAMRAGDELLVEALLVRLDDLDGLAKRNGLEG